MSDCRFGVSPVTILILIQFMSQICVSVEFESEGVESGRQRIDVEYYLCETYL